MKKLTRTLLALALASTTAQLTACGDDDGGGEPTPGPDASTTPLDSSTPGIDSGIGNDASTADSGSTPTPTPVGELAACPSDPHIAANNDQKVCVISAPASNPLKTNLSLSPVKGFKGYVLSGVVYVGEDVGGEATPTAGKAAVTLTITAGTKLAGLDDKSGLATNRGSKLDAQGTKAAPITFTSINDLLPSGTPASPTDWGGIVLMGRATQNKPGNPVTELDTGLYGGPDDADSCGTLKYVRVLYTGSRSSMEKEFNGVTFYACGSQTSADYLQIHGGSDDGVEFFGGLPNIKHLVISGQGDDSVDWTDGFRGKLQYVVAKQVPNFGDNGIEADNQQANEVAAPISGPTISNVTFLGQPSANGADGPNGIFLRRGTKAFLSSFLVTGFKKSCVNVDGATSGAFVGTPNLTIASSRISCATNYLGKGDQFFMGGTNDAVLASADVLNGYLPKSDSGLLIGGTVPSDPFFDQVPYIGAFGSDDWTAGWTVFPDFTPK
jgi:hypothetical protein